MTEVQDGTLITMEVMGCQMYAVGKAIRPLFADPVTFIRKHSFSMIISMNPELILYLTLTTSFFLLPLLQYYNYVHFTIVSENEVTIYNVYTILVVNFRVYYSVQHFFFTFKKPRY